MPFYIILCKKHECLQTLVPFGDFGITPLMILRAITFLTVIVFNGPIHFSRCFLASRGRRNHTNSRPGPLPGCVQSGPLLLTVHLSVEPHAQPEPGQLWPWLQVNLPQGTAPLFGGPWGSGLGGSDRVLLCPGGGGGGLFLDRVELPLEVCVLRGSVEGGPVGPGKEIEWGRQVNPSLTDTEQLVCNHFCTAKCSWTHRDRKT